MFKCLQAWSAHVWRQRVYPSQKQKCGPLIVLSKSLDGWPEEHGCLLCINNLSGFKNKKAVNELILLVNGLSSFTFERKRLHAVKVLSKYKLDCSRA